MNVTYLPGSLLALYVTERHGLRVNLLLGCALQTAMCAFKWAGVALPTSPHAAYGLLLCGQLLGGLGQPLLLNTVARLSGDWFPPQERDLATTVGFQASNAGAILFNALPAWVVRRPGDLSALFLAQLLCWPLVTGALATAMRADRPELPPSAATARQWAARDAHRSSMPQGGASAGAAAISVLASDLWLLARHRNFLLLTGSFSCVAGIAWALSTVEGPLIEACGYGPRVAGGAGAILLAGGCVCCAALAPWLRSSATRREYLPLQRRLLLVSAATGAMVLANNRPMARDQLLLSWALFGAAQGPLGPITLEHAAAMTWPMAADSSSAALFMACNLVSFLQTAALQSLLQRPSSKLCLATLTPAAVVVAACMAAGCACGWAMTQEGQAPSVMHQDRPGGEPAGSEDRLLGDRISSPGDDPPDPPVLTHALQRAAGQHHLGDV